MFRDFIYHHRIVSIVLVGVFLLLLFTFFFSLSGQTTPNQVSVSPKQKITVATPTAESIPTLPLSERNTYTTDQYQLSYPKTWTNDTTASGDFQGKMLDLQPAVSDPNENAHVAVEINDPQETSLDKISAGLSFLGLKKSMTTVAGIPAQKFSGTVTLSQKILHNTVYLFSSSNEIYLIKLSYQGANTDTSLEQAFAQSIDTLQFK